MPSASKKISQLFSFKNVFWALFYIFLFCLLLNNSFSYLDPDLGWHLKVGKDIIRDGHVPHLNYYNYTLEGKTWVDHEWLLNVAAYWIYQNLSNIGLNIFFALLAVLTLFIVHRSVEDEAGDQPGYVLLTVLFLTMGVIAMSPHLGVRMQEIGILCLALLYSILSNFEKKRNYRILFWLIPLFYFWASSHASFLIGLFLLVFWLGIKIFEKFLAAYFKDSKAVVPFELGSPLTKNQIFIFSGIIVLNALATMVTAYGLELYEFLKGYSDTFYMTHITEWLPSWYLPLAYWQIVFLSFSLAGIILFFIDKNNRKKKISLWELSLLVFFMILSFKSKRHFPIFFISAFPLVIKNYGKIFDLNGKDDFFNFSSKIARPFLIFTFILICLSLLLRTNFTLDPFKKFSGDYPYAAVNFLKSHPQYDSLNIFNDYAWGGYLIWAYPQRKIFIDGRLPQYPVNGHSFLEEDLKFYSKKNLPGMLDQYNIRLVLIRPKENEYKFNYWEKKFFSIKEDGEGGKNELLEFLKSSKNWKQIYDDSVAAIFVRQ
ncbi:MAG: hypothetical protein WCW77_02830 [Patescibacteria group bacterium]